MKKLWNGFTTLLVVLVLLLAIALVGVRLVGLQVFMVLSGSMEPTYHVGSLIYVKEVDPAEVKIGDPITFVLNAAMSLANFMRVQIYASMETLKYGMEILNHEHVGIDQVFGHGGLFKTEGVAQNLLAAAIHAPVTVMQTAGEGGAWGIALLASYLVQKNKGETLEEYLENRVFSHMAQRTVAPDSQDENGFDDYMKHFISCIPAQKAAAGWKI